MGLVGGASIDAPPSAYLDLLYLDSITPSDEVLDELVRRFGAGRVMLGGDYLAGMGNFKPGEGLGSLELDHERREAISSANAVRVFGLGVALTSA